MNVLHWVGAAGGVAALAAGCWFVATMVRGWKSESARPTDRPSSTTGSGTAFGRLSTIR